MYKNTHTRHKKNCRAGIAAAALLLSLLTGCSGTGTMYTPEAFREDAPLDATAAFSEDSTGEPAGEAPDSGHRRSLPDDPAADGGEDEEDQRVRRAWLEGTGSDLYTAQTVDSYYQFTLEGASLKLPCSISDLALAGWSLSRTGSPDNSAGNSAEGDEGSEIAVQPYSYEFFDAVPSENAKDGAKKNKSGQPSIRLCLGNDTGSPLAPSDCTVYGISVSADSGVSFQTAFGAGIGSQLSDLTLVFGTEKTILTQSRFGDGTVTASYRFSNGLTEGEQIAVLAEAEEKGIAEGLTARTDADGSTISSLTLYYFHLIR